MHMQTVVAEVVLGSLVLGMLSWKWCLPRDRTAVVIIVAAVAAFLCGAELEQSGYEGWIVWGASGLVQLGVYVGVILWLFYRDPDRKVPADPGAVVSPADGTVIYLRRLEAGEPLRSEKNGAAIMLDEIRETELAKQALWQIGISMVFTDVHVNRSPIAGKVTLLAHRAGQFLSLRRKEALNLNERQTLVITGRGVQVSLVQIASRLVRRIVAFVNEGQTVELGQRIGMIKFGSQVDLFVPVARVQRLEVSEQQRLTAGVTVICRLTE